MTGIGRAQADEEWLRVSEPSALARGIPHFVPSVSTVLDIGWGANTMSYDVSPDGERFLALAADESQGAASLSLFVNWKTELETR